MNEKEHERFITITKERLDLIEQRLNGISRVLDEHAQKHRELTDRAGRAADDIEVALRASANAEKKLAALRDDFRKLLNGDGDEVADAGQIRRSLDTLKKHLAAASKRLDEQKAKLGALGAAILQDRAKTEEILPIVRRMERELNVTILALNQNQKQNEKGGPA